MLAKARIDDLIAHFSPIFSATPALTSRMPSTSPSDGIGSKENGSVLARSGAPSPNHR